jgi:hypothetical protein
MPVLRIRITLMWIQIRILLVILMRIRILPFTLMLIRIRNPDSSFQIKAQNLEKLLK